MLKVFRYFLFKIVILKFFSFLLNAILEDEKQEKTISTHSTTTRSLTEMEIISQSVIFFAAGFEVNIKIKIFIKYLQTNFKHLNYT